ncbi:pyruvate dehydrogenase complex dihydrolipoamide acetyltransferase [Aureispira sp. CCB-E]|uniref:pyruvate dehydrogenase complex dihydrolipoamide acetyltransferase n=1 Tax=Aureispira sp. CCB-E TaxID=3051121 RepID=UPI0028691D17|nr:pyruvate dehydrogenase complex dihydrolipoamide acetyltransferase [Aureispira sp. CCB-E]WMX15452.1 pyruvate dehydrogenase complex dihydrolipoamide acetyltransferase [Aureispira sp. CCB-E]
MPALSDTMEEGTLVAWHKKVGDTVESGELLAEIETDKAVMEFQSFYDGVLLYIGVEEGNAVPVDAVIAVIGEEGEDYKALLGGADQGTSKKETTQDKKEAPKKEEKPSEEVLETVSAPLKKEEGTSNNSSDDRIKASPLAKAMAKEEGIDLSKVKGTGDDGRIVKRDIEEYLKNPQPEEPVAAPTTTKVPEPEGDYEDVPVSQMRKVISRRLGESKFSAPHFYLTMEICMDKLMATRKQLKELTDTKISFNDFVVKATAKALKDHKNINASWLGDKIRYYNYVNMGVAVAIDEGLVVPVVRNADTKALSQIATEIRDLAGKAKDRKLTPEQMSGNTFTISNLGMFGIDEFTAIINSPDACILAVGAINPKLVMVDGEVKESHFMKVTLSCDHRVVDGASGAKFLQTLKAILEEPMRLII